MCAPFIIACLFLDERRSPERGGACSVESCQQDGGCPRLLANATAQQPGGAQVKACLVFSRVGLTRSTDSCVLRVQDMECETVDSYVPSSSPESVADMEVSRFPDLSFVKLEPVSPCSSPTLAVMPAARGKGRSPVGC